MRAADTALEMDDIDSTVLGFAGCALADLGQADRAMPILEKAIEQDPSNAQAWAALGAAERRHVLHLEDQDIVVWRFPADPAMPWLAALMDCERARALLPWQSADFGDQSE